MEREVGEADRTAATRIRLGVDRTAGCVPGASWTRILEAQSKAREPARKSSAADARAGLPWPASDSRSPGRVKLAVAGRPELQGV